MLSLRTDDDLLFIGRGNAKVYSCNDSAVSFEVDGPQIVELPDDYASDSDDSCPELVPIDDDDTSFIIKVDTSHQYQRCPIDFHAETPATNESVLDMSAKHQEILSTVHARLEDPEEEEQQQDAMEQHQKHKQIPVIQQNNDDDDDDDGGAAAVDPVHCPRLYNSLNSRQVLVVLKSPLHFHGILNIRLLAGVVQVYGYELKRNDPAITVYSPRGHSFINISPSSNAGDTSPIESAAAALQSVESDFLNSDIYDALHRYEPTTDAIVLLERGARDSGAVRMINNYMKQTVYPNPQAFNPRRTYFTSEFILHCQFFIKPRVSLQSSAQWLAVNIRHAHTRLLVCGGKGVGKSTLVRHLVNDALSSAAATHERVLLIDLDIGQPELGLPQTVSATCVRTPILGPGYMRQSHPDLAYLVGDINVALSPIRYLRIVLRLLRECRQRQQEWNCPWIVNTMGYTKGFGLELTAAIIRALQPTDVVQIQAARAVQNFDYILDRDQINSYQFNIVAREVQTLPKSSLHEIHVFESMARKFGERTNEWDMSAKDLRFAIILAHLGNALSEDNAEWITDVVPFW